MSKWIVPLLPGAEPGDIDSHLPDGTVAVANNVYELPSIREGVRFMHAVCGFPAKSTWLNAIRNKHYVGWLLLSVTNVHKHYPETVETPRGRLNQKKAGIMSTKPDPEPLPEAEEVNVKQCFNKKERDVYIKVWEPKDTVYSDRTPAAGHSSTDR